MAQVPVPHGDRSITPVQVDGFDQSSSPVETVTTFRREFRGSCGGPDSWPIVDPGERRAAPGWTTGSCSRAAALIISVTRVMSRPSSGVSRNPSASASAIT